MDSESKRNATLDNAKLILIFAVVFGHFIEPFINNHPSLNTVYMWLYSFHMPAFILISGMLSRSNIYTQFFRKITSSILLPLIIFNLFYEGTHLIFFGEASLYLQQIRPYWVMWYLLSLLIWRGTLPLIKKVPLYLPLSLIPALLIGLITNSHELFGLSRTLYFWPFFLLGYKLTPEFLNSESFRRIPKIFCGLFLTFTFVFLGTYSQFGSSIFYGNLSYANLGYDSINGIITRSYILTISLLTSMAILRVTPNKLSVPHFFKKNTLFVYLWHGFIIKIAIALGITATMMN